MEIKKLSDPAAKRDIVERIHRLTPRSQRLWGKMDVAQMMAHCQMPLGVAIGKHKLKGSFLISLIGPLFKNHLYNDRPFKPGLPTDQSFKITDHRDFEKEKENLLQMVHHFAEDTMSDQPHPFFGKLTREQWSKGMWKHLDHHLKQFGV